MHASGSTAPGSPGLFSALNQRDFAWYFTGNLAFFFATQMNMLLQGYLARDLTGTAIALGLIGASIGLPMLIVAPLGGVIADRENKRTLLIVAQLFVLLNSLVVTVLILSGLIEFWHLLLSTVVSGLGFAFVMPARQALVPLLVPQHLMTNAITLQMGSMNVTRILGPALAGLLIAPFGVGAVWGLVTALYAIAIVSLLPLPIHGMRASRRSTGFGADLAAGFGYVAKQPLIRLLILTGMVMPLFAFPVQFVLPVVIDEVYEMDAGALGIMMSAAGIGGLVGTLVAARLNVLRRKGLVMLGGAVLMGVSFIAFALTPQFVPALILFGIGNIGGMVFQVTNNSTVQAVVDDEMRGRVMSMLMMSFGLMPLGILPLTAAMDQFGAPNTIAASSALMLGLLALLFTLNRRLRTLSVSALAHAELSPVQAEKLVAEGKITREEAARLTGRAMRTAEPAASVNGNAPTVVVPDAAREEPSPPR